MDKARIGIPSLAFFSLSPLADVAPLFEGHIDFSPIVPMNGKAILEAMALCQKSCQELGVAPLGGMPLFYHTRTACLIYAIPVGKDVAANQKARAAFSHLMEMGAAHGWGEYRIHPAFMDKGARLYDFNDNALLRLHERLKDSIDSNRILSAGRYGIWLEHLRIFSL